MPNDRKTHRDCNRKLRCEPLEKREMLSVNTASAPELPLQSEPDLATAVVAAQVENSLDARAQELAISAIHFRIDGRDVTLTSLDQLLEMKVGSSLQVVGIEYRLNGENTVEGKIAFEGYLNKLRGSRVRTDYNDGRFGGHEQEGQLDFGSAKHSGLSDAWKMEAGTESLTLVMVRYGSDKVAVEDRITVRTQVGTPDFVMTPRWKVSGSSKGIVAQRSVKIFGEWGNLGEGTYRNYAEVDIYHESDPDKIVWSGALADTVEGGETDKGQFVNKVQRDGFSRNWIPELGGTYTLKFYADPENTWNESDESNNVLTAKVEVNDLRYRAPARDAFHGFGFNHHAIVETPSAVLGVDAARSGSTSADGSGRSEDSPARFVSGHQEQPENVIHFEFTKLPQANASMQASTQVTITTASEGKSDQRELAIDVAFSDSLLND